MNPEYQPLLASQLKPSEYEPYFQHYVDLAGDQDVLEMMERQLTDIETVFADVTPENAATVHEPYQWNLKQVVGHLIDGERIFGCRAHRIACGENQRLPGFDQDLFVANTDYSNVKIHSLIQEFKETRNGNWLMFQRWTPMMWSQMGICDEKNMSVKAIACVMVGHVEHHLAIVRKRLRQGVAE